MKINKKIQEVGIPLVLIVYIIIVGLLMAKSAEKREMPDKSYSELKTENEELKTENAKIKRKVGL